MKDNLVHSAPLPPFFPQYLPPAASEPRMVAQQPQFSAIAHPGVSLYDPLSQQPFPGFYAFPRQPPPLMADPRSYQSQMYRLNLMMQEQRLPVQLFGGLTPGLGDPRTAGRLREGGCEKSTQTSLPFHNHLCSCRSETVKEQPETTEGAPRVNETDNCSLSRGPSERCAPSDPKGDLPNFSENDWTQPRSDPSNGGPNRFDLGKLSAAIQDLFIWGTVDQPQYETLSLFEKRLLYYLVKRKFAPKELKDLEPDENTCSYERLRRIFSTQLPRRPEECYKFVLTRVLKHLRRKFEEEGGPQSPETRLNETYFRPVSEKFGIPMSDFNYPLAGDQKGKFHFNFVYFSKIFKSEPFLQKIDDYTQEAIFVDFQKDLVRKVAALVHKWERNLSNDMAFLEYAQMSILRYVIFNKRCKLPWTRVDVQNAIERVKDLIQICAEGKSNIGGHLIRNANKLRGEGRSI